MQAMRHDTSIMTAAGSIVKQEVRKSYAFFDIAADDVVVRLVGGEHRIAIIAGKLEYCSVLTIES